MSSLTDAEPEGIGRYRLLFDATRVAFLHLDVLSIQVTDLAILIALSKLAASA